MENSKYTILCADDDKDNLEILTVVFKYADFEVLSCDSLEECVNIARNEKLDAIVLDNRFGNQSSLEICDKIRDFNSTIPIVFYSGEARQIEIDKVLKACADAYLIKPKDFDKLTDTVSTLIEKAQARV